MLMAFLLRIYHKARPDFVGQLEDIDMMREHLPLGHHHKDREQSCQHFQLEKEVRPLSATNLYFQESSLAKQMRTSQHHSLYT